MDWKRYSRWARCPYAANIYLIWGGLCNTKLYFNLTQINASLGAWKFYGGLKFLWTKRKCHCFLFQPLVRIPVTRHLMEFQRTHPPLEHRSRKKGSERQWHPRTVFKSPHELLQDASTHVCWHSLVSAEEYSLQWRFRYLEERIMRDNRLFLWNQEKSMAEIILLLQVTATPSRPVVLKRC